MSRHYVVFNQVKGKNLCPIDRSIEILNELMSSWKCINELQEKLLEITTSTLSSHLNVLEEAGLVVQEKVRGRYLITMP
jgi:DNA-binding HxlR family transcriptional regulator